MSNKPSIWERRRAIELEVIKEKMLKANKARTDILADNPEINSKWTPNALEIMEAKKAKKIDCVHTKLYEAQAELIDLWVEEEEKRLPPKPPMSPFG